MTNTSLRRIFLSSVTKEFGTERQLLKHDLSLPRVQVQEQGDFIQRGGKLLNTLDDYIRDECDTVLHLVGRQVGLTINAAEATWLLETYPDFTTRLPFLAKPLAAAKPTLSYTQMEAWLALYHGRSLQIYRPQQLKDHPLPANDPQQVHWKRLQDLGEHYTPFLNAFELRIEVLRDLHQLFPEEISEQHCPNSLPYVSLDELFIGRAPYLKKLHDSLQSDEHGAAITGLAMHGLGGVGKTRLAVEYAWEHAAEYSALLFVIADSPENLRQNLAELTDPKVLNLPEYAATEESARLGATLRWLAAHTDWLLILDNVDDEEAAVEVEKLLPNLQRGHVLITSRLSRWELNPLELGVLKTKDAAQFLLQRTERQGGRGRKSTPQDDEDAAALAEELGGLALALEQAGAYVVARRKSLGEYLALWRQHNQKVQQWYDKRTMNYDESVATTWQTTLDQLSEDERMLLNLLAWFAPDPVPLSVFKEEAWSAHLETGPWDEERLEDAVVKLADFSMITWNSDDETLSVHRVVQEILRTRQEDSRQWLTAALNLLNEATPTESDDVRTWPTLEPLRPHLTFMVHAADEAGIQEPTTRMMNQLASLLQTKALYSEAEPLMERVVAILEGSFGSEYPQVAVALNNLAQLLKATNRLEEAEPLMRRALNIDEQSLGEEHPKVAIRLNNLAQLLKATNRLQEAEPLMRRALGIDEQSYGEDHPDVAIDLNNLAQLLQATNRLEEAEPLMRRVVAIFEESYGSEHPQVAAALNNLASLLKATNRLEEAEPLMRRALEIDEQSYGKEHPDVARDLNNLAQLLKVTNRMQEAEPLMRRVVAILKGSFGSEHPQVAAALNNLALLLRATNRLEEAEPLMRRALDIDEQSYGEDHPDVAIDLNNLASLLQATNRLEEAEPLMRRALEIFLQSLGEEHPSTLTVAGNYGALLKEMGKEE